VRAVFTDLKDFGLTGFPIAFEGFGLMRLESPPMMLNSIQVNGKGVGKEDPSEGVSVENERHGFTDDVCKETYL